MRTVSNIEDGAFLKMFNVNINIPGSLSMLEGYVRVLNMSGIDKVLSIREYALE